MQCGYWTINQIICSDVQLLSHCYSDFFLATKFLCFFFSSCTDFLFLATLHPVEGSSFCLLTSTNSNPGITSSNFYIDWPFKPSNNWLYIYILTLRVMLTLCSFSMATIHLYLSFCSSASFVPGSFFLPCIMTLKFVTD